MRAVKAFFILTISIMLTLLLPARTVHANDDSGLIKVGYYENEIFQEGASEGAVRKGYAYEYYLKLSEYTGWKYDYVYGSFSDLYQMLLDGEIDLMAGLAYTPAREGIIGYPKQPMGSETYNLVKHASDVLINTSPSTLEGKKIGVLDSAMVGVLNEFLEKYGINAEVCAFPAYDQVLSAFDDKSVDAYVAESDGSYNREDAELLYAFGSSDYYLCVNIQRKDLLQELNTAQEQLMLEEPNYLNSLNIKYYPSSIISRSFSDIEKEWLSNNDFLSVGYLNNYMPYSDTDSSGNVTGLIKDLLPEMLRELGIDNLKVSYLSFDRYDDMVSAIANNEIDVAFPVGGGLYYSEENKIFQSTAVLTSSTAIVYAGEYSEDKLNSFALNENNRMQYYFVKTNYPNADIQYYESIDEALRAVLEGKAGCTTLNGMRANDILKNRKYRELSVWQQNNVDDRCFGVQLGNEGLLKLLNRGLNIVGTDRVQNLALRYSDELYSYNLGDILLDNMWFVALLVFVLAVIVVLSLAREAASNKKIAAQREETAKKLEEKNQQLAEAVLEAENANKAKDDFLSAMSHDIRTPLNSVLSMNEMILRESSEDKILEYSGFIESSGRTLLGLINDILDFSKIEAGKLDILPVEYQMSSVINDLASMAQPLADEKHLLLQVVVDPELPNYLRGDEIRIKQAITNLITNAIKYTNEGKITIYFGFVPVSNDDKTIYLKFGVRDTGVGIKKEEINRLFEAFERLDKLKNRNIDGTGLGLTITQKLLNLMDSSLEVESEYGVGSTFGFKLKQEVMRPERIGDYEKILKNAYTDRKKYCEKFTAPDARILVVDDAPVNLLVFKNLLKKTKAQIDTAGSADEGIELTKKTKYDIIFLDHMMPEKDGIEALGEIKNASDNPNTNTTIVCLTANAISGMREMYLSEGFDDYLTKPIDPEILEEYILKYLPEDKILPPESGNRYETGKTSFTSNELDEIYKKLRDHLDKKDYDELSDIGQMLSGTEVPETEKNRVENIVKAISDFDYDDVYKFL